jgi:hypothetical protein
MAHTKRLPAGWLKVGGRVVSNTPGIDWTIVVVEDRGPLAINGARSLRFVSTTPLTLRSSRSEPKNSSA